MFEDALDGGHGFCDEFVRNLNFKAFSGEGVVDALEGDFFHIGADDVWPEPVEVLVGIFFFESVQDAGFGADDERFLGTVFGVREDAGRRERGIGHGDDFGSAFEVDEDGSVWVMLFGELNGFGGDAVVGAAASIP